MAASGGIIREHDVAFAESFYRSVTSFDLNLAGQRDNVLTARRGMEIVQVIRRRLPEVDAGGRLQGGNLHVAAELEFDFLFLEMGLVVGSGVDACDLHEMAL